MLRQIWSHFASCVQVVPIPSHATAPTPVPGGSGSWKGRCNRKLRLKAVLFSPYRSQNCLWKITGTRRKLLRTLVIPTNCPVPMSANLLKLGWDPAKWKLGGFSLECCEVVVEKIGVKRLEATFSWHIWMGSKHPKLSCSLRCMILETVPMRYFCPKIRCCPLALTSWASTCTKPWIVLPTKVWLEKLLLGQLRMCSADKMFWIPSIYKLQARICEPFTYIWRQQLRCPLRMCIGSGPGATWPCGNPPCRNCQVVISPPQLPNVRVASGWNWSSMSA